MNDTELLATARAAAEHAYVPYSNLRVGAALIGASGAIYTGANVENAAYPSTLCAEAVAIGHAVASGERAIESLAVVSLDLTAIFPCGQCRQRMSEFNVERVIMEDPNGDPESHSLEELLPGRFVDWRRGSTST